MISFGTDGWRGIIARDFTYDNLHLVTQATAQHIKDTAKKLPIAVVGYDTRFMSRDFAEETAILLAANGITVHLTDRVATTPQVSFQTKQKAATLGIVITASHNPYKYNGFKIKGTFGGPATPETIAEVETRLKAVAKKPLKIVVKPFDEYVASRQIRLFDPRESYYRAVRKKIDLDAIIKAKFNICYDPMYGAGINMLTPLLPKITQIHGEYNPTFGDIGHPEPMPDQLRILMEKVRSGKFDIGIATDGDADRVGLIDHQGNFVDSHRIFVIILKYLYEVKGKRGSVVKTVSLTAMVDAYCKQKKIYMYETPVGFKHVAKLMASERVLVGGEESGGLGTSLHIPERDGIFNALLVLEIMANRRKSLKELCDELDTEFGPHRFRRRDVHVTNAQKASILAACQRSVKKLGRYNVIKTDKKDGFKFFVENGWLLIRASGTEPLIRFYAEAETVNKVDELLDEGLKLH